jgi:putative endonuclease
MTPRPPNHLRQGHDAEQRACDHLQGQGLCLLERNYRSRFGEIDLIMRHDSTLVFVEVRYRLSTRFGSPAETVDARKQARIRATAERYLQQHPQRPGESCRFDVVAITPANVADTGQPPRYKVDWIPDAFGI